MPTLDLLRDLTDRTVLDALMDAVETTRADIAASTGLSKPTVSDAMRRLETAGIVVETGAAIGGRGRAGRNYRLAPGVGRALAISAGPDGIRGETMDLHGEVLSMHHVPVEVPSFGDRLSAAIRSVLVEAIEADTSPIRATSLSVAGPYDQTIGRFRELPDAPFLIGELNADAVFADLDAGALFIDNDVNWMATAELQALDDPDPAAEMFYLYLGEGIGAAHVTSGTTERGKHGLAGEFGQMVTIGPGGQAMTLVHAWGEMGVTKPGGNAIDVAAMRTTLAEPDSELAQMVITALAAVIRSTAALLDPGLLVLGGLWHDVGDFVSRVSEDVAHGPIPLPVVTATLPSDPLIGARHDALVRAKAGLLGTG